MKLFLLPVILSSLGALCALLQFSVVNGQPAPEPSSRSSLKVTDCGYAAATRKSEARNSTARSQVSPFRKLFPSLFHRVSKCFSSTNVTETIYVGYWNGVESFITFNLNIALLQNITQATLNIVLAPVEDFEGVSWSQLRIVTVTGFVLPSNGSSTEGDGSGTGSTIQPIQSDNVQERLRFDALEFLKKTAAQLDVETTRVTFIVRRDCEQVDIPSCPPILNSSRHIPSLIFNY